MALDFTTEEGRDVLLELIGEADFGLGNYRPEALKEYGLDYESVREVNPNVVYRSLSWFGQDGPWRDRAGLNLTVQGLDGRMDLTGDPDGEPRGAGLAITDLVTGIYAAMGTISALYRRGTAGVRQSFEQYGEPSELPGYLVLRHGGGAQANGQFSPLHRSLLETADGFLNLALVNDELFESFCSLIDREDPARDDRL